MCAKFFSSLKRNGADDDDDDYEDDDEDEDGNVPGYGYYITHLWFFPKLTPWNKSVKFRHIGSKNYKLLWSIWSINEEMKEILG